MITIEGYNKYKITKEGEVYSSMWGRPKALKPQKASQSRKGYYQVRLFNKEYKRGKLQYIHRLVYETFVDKIPEGKEIDHIDGDTTNNSVDNLQLLTPRQNKVKGIKGKDMYWRNYRDEFIKHYDKLGTYKKVAEVYGINPNIVYRVIKDVMHKIDWTTGKHHSVRFTEGLNDYYTDTNFRTKSTNTKNRKRDDKGRFM